eukprot:TRINITY_DN3070_c0_g1_i1.p1 TRINITY_DN3070_c0_g1~~TRINITY_DN3070_c0_g1_i1.p1  ORF type:complete len:578 (+),score=55.05 TRINITY_DN3070_c0_g1_i1:567-2300(+)
MCANFTWKEPRHRLVTMAVVETLRGLRDLRDALQLPEHLAIGHFDIKELNLFFDPVTRRIRLGDFASHRVFHCGGVKLDEKVPATPEYAPPELLGSSIASEEGDVVMIANTVASMLCAGNASISSVAFLADPLPPRANPIPEDHYLHNFLSATFDTDELAERPNPRSAAEKFFPTFTSAFVGELLSKEFPDAQMPDARPALPWAPVGSPLSTLPQPEVIMHFIRDTRKAFNDAPRPPPRPVLSKPIESLPPQSLVIHERGDVDEVLDSQNILTNMRKRSRSPEENTKGGSGSPRTAADVDKSDLVPTAKRRRLAAQPPDTHPEQQNKSIDSAYGGEGANEELEHTKPVSMFIPSSVHEIIKESDEIPDWRQSFSTDVDNWTPSLLGWLKYPQAIKQAERPVMLDINKTMKEEIHLLSKWVYFNHLVHFLYDVCCADQCQCGDASLTMDGLSDRNGRYFSASTDFRLACLDMVREGRLTNDAMKAILARRNTLNVAFPGMFPSDRFSTSRGIERIMLCLSCVLGGPTEWSEYRGKKSLIVGPARKKVCFSIEAAGDKKLVRIGLPLQAVVPILFSSPA